MGRLQCRRPVTLSLGAANVARSVQLDAVFSWMSLVPPSVDAVILSTSECTLFADDLSCFLLPAADFVCQVFKPCILGALIVAVPMCFSSVHSYPH